MSEPWCPQPVDNEPHGPQSAQPPRIPDPNVFCVVCGRRLTGWYGRTQHGEPICQEHRGY